MAMSDKGPILFVDDDPDDHALVKEICRGLKIPNRILSFYEGKKVLDYLKTTTEKPLLILCDINMPPMDGLDLRKTINETEQLRKKSIPFIFLSTSANQREVDAAYDMAVQGFFEKGNQFEQLKHTINIIFEYWDKCRHPNSFR